MKLISVAADLSNMDCHLHSRFSPDARGAGADEPQAIADAVRDRGLKGFIITDHFDLGHWGDYKINFDDYFSTWERVRDNNPDLRIYIGLEVGFEQHTAELTAKIINELPFEYIINSVHYWGKPRTDNFSRGRIYAYNEYLDAVTTSLDAPYPFNTIGHLGFPERYAPYPPDERALDYALFKTKLDAIIQKAVKQCVMFEENTNAGGEMRQPREAFLRAYKAAGGVRPILGSDAHNSKSIGQYFDRATSFLDNIFNKT